MNIPENILSKLTDEQKKKVEAAQSPDELLARIGKAEKVYVRVDENKAYWVNGEDTGSVDLW